MQKRVKPTDIHIVLDTNVLFTERADKLLSPEISEYILKSHKDIGSNITWHLPEAVRGERQYQMTSSGMKLLPSIKKMENLLGIDLLLDRDKLDQRVVEAIERQISEHKLSGLALDCGKVDWPALIECAIHRRPPFSVGSEKGFKDAIILEIFLQFVERMPKTNNRIVLFSSDIILVDAAKSRNNSGSNVVVVSSLEDLQNVINAVASHLSDESVASLVQMATVLFWNESDPENTIWRKAKVLDAIDVAADGKANLAGYIVVPGKASLGKVALVEKEGQRIAFRRKIIQKLTAKPDRSPAMVLGQLGINNTLLGGAVYKGSSGLMDGNSSGGSEGASIGGRIILECQFEATLTRKGSLISPKLVQVVYEATEWDTPTTALAGVGDQT